MSGLLVSLSSLTSVLRRLWLSGGGELGRDYRLGAESIDRGGWHSHAGVDGDPAESIDLILNRSRHTKAIMLNQSIIATSSPNNAWRWPMHLCAFRHDWIIIL